MAPPSFADLGKAAKDLFNKGYTIGMYKLESTTRSDLLELKFGAVQNHASEKFLGNVDVKYKVKDYGLTITERWNTDSTLGTEITVEDRYVKNSKLTLDTTFNPIDGKRTGRIKAAYKNDNIHATTDVVLDRNGPVVTTSLVAGHQGFLGGVQLSFDSAARKLVSHALALGYSAHCYALNTFVNDGKDFGGNVYHMVNRDLELGVNFGWSAGTAPDQATKFGVGAKYWLDDRTILRARVANNSNVSVSYTHDLKDGLSFTISGLLNAARVNDTGAMKFGVGLEYCP